MEVTFSTVLKAAGPAYKAFNKFVAKLKEIKDPDEALQRIVAEIFIVGFCQTVGFQAKKSNQFLSFSLRIYLFKYSSE